MADLIDRQAAIKAICEDGTWLESQGCVEVTMAERKQRDADIICSLPSVDAEPVRHGRWIDETFKPTGLVFHPYVCDQCGCHSESNFTYCPDCGARMGGE